MGCTGSFDNLELGKNNSVTGTYPNEIATQLNCNSNVIVTVNFYDNGYDGHYRYFLVNGYPETYSTTLLVDNTGTSSGVFTFSTDKSISISGSYYGSYEVTALNLDTRRYTVQQYTIAAYENGPYSKIPAVSTFKAKPTPKLPNNNGVKAEDNTTKDTKVEDNSK